MTSRLNDPAFYCVLLNGEARELQKMLAEAGKRSERDLDLIYALAQNAASNATIISNWVNDQRRENQNV
jgi:hypothetical protein